MSAQFVTIETPHGSAHDGSPAVMARYRTLVEVRHAIESLESSGVDGDDLALVGEAAVASEQTVDRRRTDGRFLSSVGLSVAVGTLAGAVIGAIAGAALVAPVVLLWSGLASPGWVFGLMVGWFAAGGALLGAFFAVERRIGFSESWPLTFEDDPETPLWLAVYDSDESVQDALRATHPLTIVADPVVETSHPDTIGLRPA